MLDPEQLRDFLNKPEAPYIDFKAGEYDLESPRGQRGNGYLDLLKDILCMSNTPREGNAYIITGVRNKPGSRNWVIGIKTNIDDNEIQALLCNWLKPIPPVHYYELRAYGKYIGVFEVRRDQLRGPYYVSDELDPAKKGKLRNEGKFLIPDDLYFRRGTRNDWARESDKEYIIDWFNTYRNERWQDWDNFKADCDYFDFGTQRHYILITSPLSHIDQPVLESLSHVSWSAVIDFDRDSDQKGLLKAFQSTQRDVIRVVKGEYPSFNSWQNTYWFFAQGLSGRQGTLVKRNNWRAWRTNYGKEIDEQFRHIARYLLPNSVTFVVIWNDDSLLRHLQTTIESTAGFNNSKIVIVSEAVDNIRNRVDDEEFELNYYEIPIDQLLSGLSVEFPKHTLEGKEFTFPSGSGSPILVPTDRLPWLQSQLELVHLGIGTESSPDDETEDDESDFLRGGGIITWNELNLRRDADRDITSKIARRVRDDLGNRANRIKIFHVPGAGGTTISRRIIWDLHKDYPSVVIHSGDSKGIVERIEFIVAITRLPVLALADSAEIAEREIEGIYNLLQSRRTGCILLSVSRHHQLPRQTIRSFPVQLKLTASELHRFFDKYAKFVPGRRNDLKSLVDTNNKLEQTAFHFGLTAYGEDYRGLQSYVSHRINNLTDTQKQLIGFLSIAYMYGQKGMPEQIFRYLLGLPNQDISLSTVFENQQPVFDILILDNKDWQWRLIHQLVAQEILRQILTPAGADPRVWKQQLSLWGKNFIKFCKESQLITSETILKLLKRVFIERDTVDVLGREPDDDTRRVNSRIGSSSLFIQDIPSPEGRLEVLKFLTEMFPEEAHFWGHLGRFQAAIMRNYPDSLEAAEQAIQLQPEDPLLWHMKGMNFRYQAQGLMESNEILAEIVALAEQASECFEKSRDLNPGHEHAYISEIQLLAKVLNYAGNTEESIFQYIKRYDALPYVRDAIDKAESLLAIVRSNREGTGSSSYEEGCRAQISRLYGDYQEALQIWDSLLSRQDVHHPPIRRQIVYALQDRDKTWHSMPQRSRDRCIRLLQNNLDEQPYNGRDLRLWLQAVRYSSRMPSIESLIEKVSYWKANTGVLDATYYLYVLYSLRVLEGGTIEQRDRAGQYMDESENLSQNRRNRSYSFEWLGRGEGIGKLVHQSVLGNWDRERNFWSNTKVLERTDGIITRVSGPQAGNIEIGGLSSFFVPGGTKKDEPISKDSVNRRVDFFLGFSYSGLRAWDVQFKD